MLFLSAMHIYCVYPAEIQIVLKSAETIIIPIVFKDVLFHVSAKVNSPFFPRVQGSYTQH
jgi:hypothetical protein